MHSIAPRSLNLRTTQRRLCGWGGGARAGGWADVLGFGKFGLLSASAWLKTHPLWSFRLVHGSSCMVPSGRK